MGLFYMLYTGLFIEGLQKNKSEENLAILFIPCTIFYLSNTQHPYFVNMQ